MYFLHLELSNSFIIRSRVTFATTLAADIVILFKSPFIIEVDGGVNNETIEYIHRAALLNEISEINDANIEAWFNSNYETFSKKEHAYLAPAQLSGFDVIINRALRNT